MPSPASGSLAVQWRPRRFADVVGQRHVTAVLRRAVAAHRVPHQLLFSGPSGLGKTTLARIAAAAILCEHPDNGDACTVCASCVDIMTPGRTHPDVIEFDAASNGGKDNIRDLAARAQTAPMRAAFKIYIVDEAHGLTRDGGSAFLKLLEEPPAHVIFMLATTDPDKMLRTNRGRCVEFELVRPTNAEIADRLLQIAAGESWTLSEATANAVVDATDPALGIRGCLMTLEKLSDALSWGSEPTEDELATLLGVAPARLVQAVADAVVAGDRAAVLTALGRLRAKVSDEQARKALIGWARGRLITVCAGTVNESSEVALWRYETLVEARPGVLWTEIALVKITNPELVPSPRVMTVYLTEASEAIAALRTGAIAARSAVPQVPAEPIVAASDSGQAPAAVVSPGRAQAVAPAERSASRPAPRPTTARPAPAAAPASRPAAPSAPAAPSPPATPSAPSAPRGGAQAGKPGAGSGSLPERFRAALVARSKPAAAAFDAATVSCAGSTVTLHASPGLSRQFDRYRLQLDEAARDAGVTVTVTVTG